ncbi:hypothetical protein AAE250_12985 [Bacteroides sp. GD17]|uniref:hypothetical protein n=1 Tax=Bacteroides sp. GD17 TaxID=3139826 RepID=UPI00313DC3D0
MGTAKSNPFWGIVMEMLNQKFKEAFGKDVKEVLEFVMANLNSDFEKQCLVCYFLGKGAPLQVSDDVFKRAAAVAVEARAASEKRYGGPTPVTIDGKKYYSQVISFYDSDEFNYAFGCATVFFDENGVPVGLKDRYDFDMAGHRDKMAEKLTELMAKIEHSKLGGKPYDIYYGIHD